FAMRFSPTCWYEATASLYEKAQPWILIEGGGDDCGVCISVQVTGDANVPSRPVVDLKVPRGAKRGHDSGAIVRALRDIPGWRGVAAISAGDQAEPTRADELIDFARKAINDKGSLEEWRQGLRSYQHLHSARFRTALRQIVLHGGAPSLESAISEQTNVCFW